MHSEGLELTKLTYIRLEDNVIRHRDDRYKLCTSTRQKYAYVAIAGRGVGHATPNVLSTKKRNIHRPAPHTT